MTEPEKVCSSTSGSHVLDLGHGRRVSRWGPSDGTGEDESAGVRQGAEGAGGCGGEGGCVSGLAQVGHEADGDYDGGRMGGERRGTAAECRLAGAYDAVALQRLVSERGHTLQACSPTIRSAAFPCPI